MSHDPQSRRALPYLIVVVVATPLVELGSPRTILAGEVPNYELFGGYAFLRDEEIETSFPVGWNISLGRSLTKSFSVVADAGGNYRSDAGVKLNVHALLAGARLSLRGRRVTPYVETLGGVARAAVRAGGASASNSEFAVQGGVGLSVKVTESVSFRTGLGFRNIFTSGKSAQEFGVVAGLSFGFGGSKLPGTVVTPQPVVAPAPAPRRPPESTPPPVATPSTPPAAPVPQLPRRPLPPAALARGQESLRAGNYSAAAVVFREDLRVHAPHKFTIPVGVYCEASNVAQQVRTAQDATALFVLHLRLRRRLCYGLYWGLFDSMQDAEAALARLSPSLITSGQTPMSVSQILSRSR